MNPRLDKLTLALTAMQVATQAGLGIQQARMDDGKVDGEEGAAILTNALESGAIATGLSQVVVYRHGESATSSTAGRIAAGFIQAGSIIQHAMRDGQVTLGECLTALRTGLTTAFAKSK